MNVAFVEPVAGTWLRMTDLVIARDCQDHGVPLMDTDLGLRVVQSRAGDGHALDQLGVRFVEGECGRHRLDGAEDRRRGGWSARCLVLPVSQVILRPGIPEPDHGLGGVVVDGPGELIRAVCAGMDQRLAEFHRSGRWIDHLDERGAVLNGVQKRGSWPACDQIARLEKSDLVGLSEIEVQSGAPWLIGGAASPSDGRRDRLRAAAREHVFVILPLPVPVARRRSLERALRKDVGARRDFQRCVRVVGHVVERPALSAEILPEELVVVGGECPDFGLQKVDRINGASPAVDVGIRAGRPAAAVGGRPGAGALRHHPDVVGLHGQLQVEVVDVGDVVIDQRDQLVVRDLAIGPCRDLRIDQVAVVADRPLRELILDVVVGSLRDAGPIPHHDAVLDRVLAGFGIGNGAVPVGVVCQRIGESGRCEVLSVGPDADTGAVPENQRHAHEDAFARLQTEVVFAALLVTDVAAVFHVGRIVGIIQTHPGIPLEGVRVGVPHDRINGLRGVVGDSQSFQGHGVAVGVDPICQKLPGPRPCGGRIGVEGLLAIIRLPSAVTGRHQVIGLGHRRSPKCRSFCDHFRRGREANISCFRELKTGVRKEWFDRASLRCGKAIPQRESSISPSSIRARREGVSLVRSGRPVQ